MNNNNEKIRKNIEKGEEIINYYMSDDNFEELQEYHRKLKNQNPTDLIQISNSDYKKLKNKFKDNKSYYDNGDNLSSDIMISGLVSLLNIEIVLTDDKNINRARILINDNYQELIQIGKEINMNPIVGCVLLYNMIDVIFPIAIDLEKNTILSTPPFPNNVNDPILNKDLDFSFDKNNNGFKELTGFVSTLPHAMYLLSKIYEIWYTIQISMLHPILKNIYSNPSTSIIHISSNNNKKKKKNNKKKKIVYYKKHIITDDKINKVFDEYKTSHKNQRHEMLWYVAGHWRTYKDGRKIFIKPHWKGPLRDSKNKIGIETRERVIPIEEKNED